ncbi:ER membrane protein complex subunit 10 [Lasioglossum baleicum]|uniref:ER membrane protein complex subunit 10 n=1 Tax=Lasioglossum baleicum TaxID=434251 RepID=UPI003FCC4499
MCLANLFISLIVCTSSMVHGSDVYYDPWIQLRVYHAFNDEPEPIYVERGNITLPSVRSGVSVVGQNGLLPSQTNELVELAKQDGKYRLKVVARIPMGRETTFLTSVPACYLLGSDLEDIITIWLDSMAEPIAISQTSPGPCSIQNPFTNMWTTDVVVKYPDGGPVPDTATYILKVEREREARERGEAKDNRPYLSRYWMYIFLAFIFVVLSAATNPEAAAGSGGSAQRQ